MRMYISSGYPCSVHKPCIDLYEYGATLGAGFGYQCQPPASPAYSTSSYPHDDALSLLPDRGDHPPIWYLSTESRSSGYCQDPYSQKDDPNQEKILKIFSRFETTFNIRLVSVSFDRMLKDFQHASQFVKPHFSGTLGVMVKRIVSWRAWFSASVIN